MAARLLDGCGVPSGSITSHITSAPLDLAGSGKTATGCSMQSELLPSAWRVELPSKPHIGSSSRVGKTSNSSIFVLPRRFGTGSWPSSQMYSSLYLAISSPVLSLPDRVRSCWSPFVSLQKNEQKKRPERCPRIPGKALEASLPLAARTDGTRSLYSHAPASAQAGGAVRAAIRPPAG